MDNHIINNNHSSSLFNGSGIIKNKVFNDNVHGHMTFHPLLVKIIDTPQFQRLRNLKQVSTVYLVYPGANHNRFEHSLGVCYLAGEMVDALKRNSYRAAKLISEKDKLCVQVAGLLHDVGHGPYSHIWETFLQKCNIIWRHEDCSLEMFEFLLKENPSVREEFERNNLNEKHIDLIKELIKGEGSVLPKEKNFLYQIISNSGNGIDVDKWDYFLRDGQHLNMNIIFDYQRLLQFCQVSFKDSKSHIVFQEKEALNIYNMFQMRSLLHFHAYQHRVTKNTEAMLIDAFLAADKADYGISVPGKKYKLSEAHTDMEAFQRMTDHIFYDILFSCNEDLKEAQAILQRLLKRDLYQLIGISQKQPQKSHTGEYIQFSTLQKQGLQEDMKRDIADGLSESPYGQIYTVDDFVIKMISIDFGSSKQNDPFKNIYFYPKNNPDDVNTMDSSTVPVFGFTEQSKPIFFRLDFLVLCRKHIKKEDKEALKQLFRLQ